MATRMDRRTWLRNGALMTGGLTFFSGVWNSLSALPARAIRPFSEKVPTDEMIAAQAPPELKARLFANENPFGPSDKAKAAIAEALPDSYKYAFGYTRQLAQKIAGIHSVQEEQVLLAAGSTPILLAAAMHFARNGGNIISGDPSYSDLPEKAELFNAHWIKTPLTADYKLDLDAIEQKIDSNTSLVYLCNPNNPTATVLDTAALKAFCERVSTKVPVFIDEAYIDYVHDPAAVTLMDCVHKGMNVVVTRTFSKLYGFAGLRVGYAIGQPDLIKELDKYTVAQMGISAPSANAAIASLDDTSYAQNVLQKTQESKDYLYSILKAEGYTYIPSSTNFVMFPLKMEGRRFVQEMMKRGVGIRNWTFAGKDWCRVSIGTMDEMKTFAKAFKEIS